jgi:hypothetical protein
VGDAAALAAAIISELENPHDPKLLIQRSQDFSVEAILPKYLALFNLESLGGT